MADYTKRMQILLSEEQNSFLRDLAERRGQSVGDLVRNAVDYAYRPAVHLNRARILEKLAERVYINNISMDDIVDRNSRSNGVEA